MSGTNESKLRVPLSVQELNFHRIIKGGRIRYTRHEESHEMHERQHVDTHENVNSFSESTYECGSLIPFTRANA